MCYGIKLKVWGRFACFTRPEMKVERVSYDVMTPSAAKGILEAIYWKPEMKWIIDRIHVLKPIRFDNIRRNELVGKIPSDKINTRVRNSKSALEVFVDDTRKQRAAMILRDVAYVIEAHFECKDSAEKCAKHKEMFERRARKGQYFHQPYFGCREFPVAFESVAEVPQSELNGRKDLGWILYDIDFKKEMAARFFHAFMHDGIINVPPLREMSMSA